MGKDLEPVGPGEGDKGDAGGFSFTKETTQAKLGPLELTVKDKESVNVPQWLSLGAIALGAVVLVLGFRKN